MPIYEYRCENCGTFEVTQRITDKPLRRCPTCKGKVSKLISTTSFQLKGSGWYQTDYASKGGGQKSKDEGKADGKSEAASAKESKDTSSTSDASPAKSSKSEASAA